MIQNEDQAKVELDEVPLNKYQSEANSVIRNSFVHSEADSLNPKNEQAY